MKIAHTIKFIITNNINGLWYGRIDGLIDNDGNEPDCQAPTTEVAFKLLMEQYNTIININGIIYNIS
jgi:hypothetical protein